MIHTLKRYRAPIRQQLLFFKLAVQASNKETPKLHITCPSGVEPAGRWWIHITALRWRHNERDGVSNHQPHDCWLNRLFRRPASLAFVPGTHRWSVNSPHKGPVTRKMFPFDDVIMEGPAMQKASHHLGTTFDPGREHAGQTYLLWETHGVLSVDNPDWVLFGYTPTKYSKSHVMNAR